jgi:hypothetical protein
MFPVESRAEACRYGHIVDATVPFFTNGKIQESVKLIRAVPGHVRGLALAERSDFS